MKFAMYGRKSVYSDKSDSVSNQERMCREYAEIRFDVESFEVYSDEGFTGANTNRPGLKRLMEDIEDGLVDALIVYQLDRISRNVKDFSDIYSTLEKKGVMFVSIKENIDTATPIGKAMMYVTMVFAQMERETIAARVDDNMRGLAKRGLWTGGKPPCGYSSKQIDIDGKKHAAIFPEPEGVKYVNWIFDTFLENNYSLSRMEAAFKKQGIRSLGGAFFSTSQIHKILTMPYCVEATPEIYDFYKSKGCVIDESSPREKWDGSHGVMIYGRTTHKTGKHTIQPPEKWIVCIGNHKPFMSAEKWLTVQEKFDNNISERKKKYDINLLKGVLRCGKCGCLMRVTTRKKKKGISRSYFCATRARKGADFCDMKNIKCDILDEKVLDRFREIEDNPKIIMDYVESDAPKNNVGSMRGIEAGIAKTESKIDRLAETLSESRDSVAAKYILKQIEKEAMNLEALKREMEIAKSEDRKIRKAEKSVNEKTREITRLIKGLDRFSANERNDIVRDIVKECTWDGETLFLHL